MPTYLKVPYSEKDQAKALGARWDPTLKSWYVPEGKDASPFARWLLAQGQPSGPIQPQNPGWLRLARYLGRGPSVLLLENTCWKCQKSGFAVSLALHLKAGEEYRIPEDIREDLGIGSGPEGSWVNAEGGAVGHPLVLDQLREHIAKAPDLRGQVATFKKRFSRTVGEAYLSQGCPHCDALWGDFPLEELSIAYIEQIARREYGKQGLIWAFDLVLPH